MGCWRKHGNCKKSHLGPCVQCKCISSNLTLNWCTTSRPENTSCGGVPGVASCLPSFGILFWSAEHHQHVRPFVTIVRSTTCRLCNLCFSSRWQNSKCSCRSVEWMKICCGVVKSMQFCTRRSDWQLGQAKGWCSASLDRLVRSANLDIAKTTCF